METLILYYSYGGSTRLLAEKMAAERSADVVEVKDVKKPGMFGALFFGCPAAMKQKPGKVQPFEADFSAYERLVVMGPVWGGFPAPPVNSIIEKIPSGAQVELVMTSGSGHAKDPEKIKALVLARGAKVVSYTDVQTAKDK